MTGGDRAAPMHPEAVTVTTRALGLTTAEALLQMPRDGVRRELVDGELRTMAPAGYVHGRVAVRVAHLLMKFVEQERLGDVLGAETGFRLSRDPDTVRAPDAAFVAAARIPEGAAARGFAEMAPDLVVEVVSPSDRATDVLDKAQAWLAAGVRIVWVLYPDQRLAIVYDGAAVAHRGVDDVLDGGEVLPGLQLPVADLFG